MIKKWKLVDRADVLDHPRMKLVEDTVELPNGKQTTYLRHTPTEIHSAAVIAINDEGKILIQREYSYPPDEVMYQLPGGGMLPGETPEQGALRELAEESGYTATECRVLGFSYPDNRRSNHKQYIVECRNLSEHNLPEDPEEFIENLWLTRQEINDLIKQDKAHNMHMLAALQILDAQS